MSYSGLAELGEKINAFFALTTSARNEGYVRVYNVVVTFKLDAGHVFARWNTPEKWDEAKTSSLESLKDDYYYGQSKRWRKATSLCHHFREQVLRENELLDQGKEGLSALDVSLGLFSQQCKDMRQPSTPELEDWEPSFDDCSDSPEDQNEGDGADEEEGGKEVDYDLGLEAVQAFEDEEMVFVVQKIVREHLKRVAKEAKAQGEGSEEESPFEGALDDVKFTANGLTLCIYLRTKEIVREFPVPLDWAVEVLPFGRRLDRHVAELSEFVGFNEEYLFTLPLFRHLRPSLNQHLVELILPELRRRKREDRYVSNRKV